jgi:hypothetical protein
VNEKIARARTFGELIRGVVLVGVGVRLVLVAVNELRAAGEVLDLPAQPPAPDEAPAEGEAPTPA